MSLHRVFFSLPIDISAAREMCNYLKPHISAGTHLTDPENYHITLAFMDSISDQQFSNLKYQSQALRLFLPLQVSPLKIRPFPKARSRLLAAEIAPSDELMAVYQQVQDMLERLDIGTDKHSSFLPHITMAKSKYLFPESSFHLFIETKHISLNTLGLYQGFHDDHSYRYRSLFSVVGAD